MLLAACSHEVWTHLEAHGTGTALGDPIEVSAAADFFVRATVAAERNFQADRQILLSAVKATTGHLEAAAAMPGICKTDVISQGWHARNA